MAASDDLKAADEALSRRVRSYTFQGKTYSLTELRDVLLPQLKRAAEAEEKAKRKAEETARRERAAASAAEAASAEAKRLEIEAAKSAVAQAQQSLTSKTNAFRDGRATEADLRKAENELAAAQTRLATAQGQAAPVAAAGVPTPVRERAVQPSTGGIRIPTRGERGETTLADVTAGEPPPPPPPPTTGAPKKGKKKAAAAPAADGGFMDELAVTFPAYSGMTEADATAYFGADLVDVFRRANQGEFGNDLSTAAAKAAIERAISQTSYWRTTQASIKNWDQLAEPDRQKRITDQKALIAASYGDLGLDDATLTDLATIAQRTGLTELGLKQMVYGRAFARPVTATLDTRALALEGGAADQIRAVGRAYGYTPSAAEIESILTGKPLAGTGTVLTEDALRQKAQKAAKGQYGWLADQIDAGLSLDDIFTNYRNYAARTLQKDPSEIDFTNPLYAEAFGSKETGQLSLNDWTRKLKTDKRYGWQYTDEANQQVNAVVSTLERAFGLVK